MPEKLLESINKFRKVIGYKSTVKKFVIFLYHNNDQPEKEIQKIIPFTIASKRLFRNKLNQGDEKLRNWKLQSITKQIKYKWMKRHPISWVWKT